jgi:hypothetical protein
MPLPPLTVTIAVLGTTVKLSSSPTSILLIDSVLRVKESALDPESSAVKAPVAMFPMLLTVTLLADCAP